MSIYRATVINNEDPAGKGRVLLSLPEIYGNVPTDWVPATTDGPVVPPVHATVWVFFHGGDETKPVYIAYGKAASESSGFVRNDDERLSNERPPIAGSVTGGSSTGAKIALGTITEANISSANLDGLPSVLSMRTLGLGAQQAAAGNHVHGGDGYREVIMEDGVTTPTPLTIEDGTDWIYAD